jgi:hypothetical protein
MLFILYLKNFVFNMFIMFLIFFLLTFLIHFSLIQEYLNPIPFIPYSDKLELYLKNVYFQLYVLKCISVLYFLKYLGEYFWFELFKFKKILFFDFFKNKKV